MFVARDEILRDTAIYFSMAKYLLCIYSVINMNLYMSLNEYFVLISGLRYTMAGTHPSSDQVFFTDSTFRQHKINGL